jgi:hypothetical protein
MDLTYFRLEILVAQYTYFASMIFFALLILETKGVVVIGRSPEMTW